MFHIGFFVSAVTALAYVHFLCFNVALLLWYQCGRIGSCWKFL